MTPVSARQGRRVLPVHALVTLPLSVIKRGSRDSADDSMSMIRSIDVSSPRARDMIGPSSTASGPRVALQGNGRLDSISATAQAFDTARTGRPWPCRATTTAATAPPRQAQRSRAAPRRNRPSPRLLGLPPRDATRSVEPIICARRTDRAGLAPVGLLATARDAPAMAGGLGNRRGARAGGARQAGASSERARPLSVPIGVILAARE
jgi:hypothetical protein